jgi:hypothetical protein
VYGLLFGIAAWLHGAGWLPSYLQDLLLSVFVAVAAVVFVVDGGFADADGRPHDPTEGGALSWQSSSVIMMRRLASTPRATYLRRMLTPSKVMAGATPWSKGSLGSKTVRFADMESPAQSITTTSEDVMELNSNSKQSYSSTAAVWGTPSCGSVSSKASESAKGDSSNESKRSRSSTTAVWGTPAASFENTDSDDGVVSCSPKNFQDYYNDSMFEKQIARILDDDSDAVIDRPAGLETPLSTFGSGGSSRSSHAETSSPYNTLASLSQTYPTPSVSHTIRGASRGPSPTILSPETRLAVPDSILKLSNSVFAAMDMGSEEKTNKRAPIDDGSWSMFSPSPFKENDADISLD